MDQLLLRRVVDVRAEFAAAVQARGDFIEAERLYLLAVRQAEILDGYYSPLAGHMLIGLHDLYESQRRDEEAAQVWERIRQILILGFCECFNDPNRRGPRRIRRVLKDARDEVYGQ